MLQLETHQLDITFWNIINEIVKVNTLFDPKFRLAHQLNVIVSQIKKPGMVVPGKPEF